MAADLSKYIDGCETKKTECHPFVRDLSHLVLKREHYDFVKRACGHVIENKILKFRKMVLAAIKRTTDKNGCFHHNGAEACLIAFHPFIGKDVDWAYYKRKHEKKYGVGTWGQK